MALSFWEGYGATILCRHFCSGFSDISLYIYISIYIYVHTPIANSRNLEIHQNSQVFMYITITFSFASRSIYRATEFKVNRNLALWIPFEWCLFLNLWPIHITFNKSPKGKLLLLKSRKSFLFSSCVFDNLTCV